MNKNIKIKIALGAILVFAIFLNRLIWLNSRQPKQNKNMAVNRPNSSQQLPKNDSANLKIPDAQQATSNPDNNSLDCKKNEPQFMAYSADFFGGKSYLAWCEDCRKNNGKPEISQDAGPFCNRKTLDSGKSCTDSKQCEGYCITKDKNAAAGACTEFKSLGSGCGWLEMVGGKVEELCAD